jgi:predicted Zn-dependent protease
MTDQDAFLFAAAQRRHAANDRTGALVLLEELLRVRPGHAPALLPLAELQLATSPVAAANAAHRVVQSNPGDQQAMELLARALSAMGRHDEALHAFRDAAAAAEHAIELDPAARRRRTRHWGTPITCFTSRITRSWLSTRH